MSSMVFIEENCIIATYTAFWVSHYIVYVSICSWLVKKKFSVAGALPIQRRGAV